MKKLIITMGSSGVGKTTYANELIEKNGWPCVRFDTEFDYKTKKCSLSPLIEASEKSDVVVLDGFNGWLDPCFKKVKQTFAEVELIFIYMDIDLLHEIQKAKQAQPGHDLYRKKYLYPDETINYQASVISLKTHLSGAKRVEPYATTVKILKHIDGKYEASNFIEAEKSKQESIIKYIDKIMEDVDENDAVLRIAKVLGYLDAEQYNFVKDNSTDLHKRYVELHRRQ